MAGEFEGIREPQGDGVENRIMDIALGLMREVKAEVGRMNDKLDKIADERRDEAREHGGLEVRLEVLENSHKAVRWITFTVAGVLVVGLLAFLLRLAVLHPEAVAK